MSERVNSIVCKLVSRKASILYSTVYSVKLVKRTVYSVCVTEVRIPLCEGTCVTQHIEIRSSGIISISIPDPQLYYSEYRQTELQIYRY